MSKKEKGTDGAPDSPPSQNLLQILRDRLLQLRRIIKERGVKEGVYAVYNYVRFRAPLAFANTPEGMEPPVVAVPPKKDLMSWSKDILTFPETKDPDVSIIIPVYNKWGYTYNCLKSILDLKDSCTYEIIIADDNSGDETANLEEYVKNVVHVRNEVNLNFLRNCNNAAKSARGRYILFLNNDTLVRQNWLDSLFVLLENDDTIGMAGSKFIFTNGCLQEAGGIIWNDATGWNFGPSWYMNRSRSPVWRSAGPSRTLPTRSTAAAVRSR